MTRQTDIFNDPNTLFGRLRAACSREWNSYCDHEFVRQLGEGSLPEKNFRHYLQQDYLFLIQFCRAWGLAVYKAETLSAMRAAAETLNSLLNQEMDLHVRYCAKWGLKEEEMQQVPEARANMAYTRYVLDRGLAGDVLDLFVALAPCTIGYAVIGLKLAAESKAQGKNHPYKEWIAAYAGQEYQRVARDAVIYLDALAAARLGSGRLPSLVENFRQATRLEIEFWEMGLSLQG